MISRRLYEQVKERDGHFCLFALPGCLGEGTCIDHRANRGAGGSKVLDHPANLVLACGPCNGAKADAHSITRLDLIDRGLLIIPDATHEKTLRRAMGTPVVYLDGESFYLVSATKRVHAVEADSEVPF